MRLPPAFAHAIRAAALDHAAAVVRARLEALAVKQVKVTTKRDQIVVVLPAGDRPEVQTARQVIEAPGRLDWKVVDEGSDYMKHLFQHVGSTGRDDAPTDARATGLGIHARVDAWRDEAGARHYDYYLDAPDREESVRPGWAAKHGCGKGQPAPEPGKVRCTVTGRTLLERYISGDRDLGEPRLADNDAALRLPDDREIGFELAVTSDGTPAWRTYYLERRVALSGTRIDNAFTSTDPNTHSTTVIVELDRIGAWQLAELTSQHVGHKLAFILDGTIKAAPIVNSPINGGKVAINLSRDATDDQAVRLAIALKTGSLPAPLRAASVRPVKR
jgi:preprotein translocase subunit SecD